MPLTASELDRREFIALSSVASVSAATAAGVIGAIHPDSARADTQAKLGGTLRIAMNVKAVDDPIRFDWPEKGNVARQFLEGLVRWNADLTFAPQLLEGWIVSDDSRTYTLQVRRGVTWTNGDAFTADDVIHNIRRWCDTTIEGSVTPGQFAALVDAGTGQLRAGAVERVDDHTVVLHLQSPDVTLIPAMSTLNALCVHPRFDGSAALSEAPIGTGAFELESLELGIKARCVRRRDGKWWGGAAYLDAVEFIDLGSDASLQVASFEANEIDMNMSTSADFIEVLDAQGLDSQTKSTANTILARMRVDEPPYDDQRVRQAIQMAVDNRVVLELGFGGRGLVAENHHCGPMHPEYAELPPQTHDPSRASEVMTELGLSDTELEIISADEDWQSNTADAVAAQLRDAGLKVKRTVVPGATFWNDWNKYPFSLTWWVPYPLAVSVYRLAYHSEGAWNETGFASREFDALLDEAAGIFDAEERKVPMAKMEKILQDSGVLVQPYWTNSTQHYRTFVKNYDTHVQQELHLEHVWIDG